MKLPATLIALMAYFPIIAQAAGDSFLMGNAPRSDKVHRVLEHEPVRDTDCRQPPIGPIDATLCNYETLESVNDDLFDLLHQLVDTPFFKYYKVNLYRDCPFWEDDEKCASRDCVISAVEESKIPPKWRSSSLSKVKPSSLDMKHSLPGCYYRDFDYCYQDDPDGDGEYIDLSENPERFTGYSGASARGIWKAIYEENCFGQYQGTIQAETYSPLALNPLLQLEPEEEAEPEGECLEKRVYYKLISGLHASISTHLCFDHFDRETGKWGPNLQCFIDRVASHPERLQYIYFNTVLLLRSISRLGPYISAFDICAEEEDPAIKSKLANVISIADRVGKFDETILFRGENANLRTEFKEHFRNVSRIMDCVGCGRCRLWGKLQIQGLGTALKALFELDEKTLNPATNPDLLQRSEVVALINTAHRFTESLHAVDEFRRLWAIAENREVMIEKMEETLKNDPLQPASVGKKRNDAHTPQGWYGRLHDIASLCTENAYRCIWTVIASTLWIIDSLSTIFRVSGKDGLPREDL